jgi:hypothetical protein
LKLSELIERLTRIQRKCNDPEVLIDPEVIVSWPVGRRTVESVYEQMQEAGRLAVILDLDR